MMMMGMNEYVAEEEKLKAICESPGIKGFGGGGEILRDHQEVIPVSRSEYSSSDQFFVLLISFLLDHSDHFLPLITRSFWALAEGPRAVVADIAVGRTGPGWGCLGTGCDP